MADVLGPTINLEVELSENELPVVAAGSPAFSVDLSPRSLVWWESPYVAPPLLLRYGVSTLCFSSCKP
jgi:hypothetical protein